MQHARRYRDLIVDQKTRQVANAFFHISKSFPKEEKYLVTDQGRRPSRSIGAQIAEAWAKRRYEKHFISKLTDDDGEQQETQHLEDIAVDCGYLDELQRNEFISELTSVGRMLQSMIEKADQFCGTSESCSVREIPGDYFIIEN